VGARSGKAYRLGDKIAVRLAEAAPLTGGLRFDLVDDDKPARPARTGPSRVKTKRR